MKGTGDRPIWSSPIVVALVMAAPMFAATLYFTRRQEVVVVGADERTPLIRRNRSELVGGIRRPASDFRSRRRVEETVNQEPKNPYPYGTVAALRPDANPQVQSAFKALTTDTQLQRTGPMFKPGPFDRKAYEADPKSYLDLHEPGRIFQSAQPGEDVSVIKPVGARNHRIKQGEAIRLAVKTEAGMPVTFTSFDLGTFSNGLASITVAANQEGVAEATFSGSSGTVGLLNILAASPVAAERVKFSVFVIPPPGSEP